MKRIYRLRSRYAVYRRQGRLWLLDNRNWVDQQLIVRRPYEVEQLRQCRELIDRHRITHFFDVGANFGLYSVLLADCPTLQVISAFEPLPRNLNQLAANLYLNSLDAKATLNGFALGASPTRMELYVDTRSTGVSTLNPEAMSRDKGAYASREEVDVKPLDHVSAVEGQRVFLKIDVEGSELGVLRGMQRFLALNDAWLQIETSPNTLDAVCGFMAQAGYEEKSRIGPDSYFERVG